MNHDDDYAPPESGTLVGLVAFGVRNLRWITVIPIVTATLGLVFSLFFSTYKSHSSFTPYAPTANLAGVAGIAAQFGFNLPTGDANQSVDFYARLLTSRALLAELATTPLTIYTDDEHTDSLSGTFIDIAQIEESEPREALLAAVTRLQSIIDVHTDLSANVVEISVSARYVDLAEQLNRMLLDRVHAFNVQKRQSQAAAERAFVEDRLEEASANLDAAEEALEQFFDANRDYDRSPRLRFQAARLQRTIDLRQQLFMSLAQAFQEASIEQVRNTPLITIIDAPEGSASTRSPLIIRVLFGVFAGLLLALAASWIKELFLAETNRRPQDYTELRRQFRDEIRHLFTLRRQ